MNRGSQKRSRLNLFLPDDVLLRILPLLPFESILECKRVCKQWYSLINDPKFSKNYQPDGSIILLLDKTHLYCILTRHNNAITVHRIPILLDNEFVCIHQLIPGWFNGIACVKDANGFFHLYNLFTGVLHPVKDTLLLAHYKYWTYYGFGYDRYDDDYKIVAAVRNYKATVKSLYWVYSSRNRCWKSFNGFPAAYSWETCLPGYCCSLNGVLHSVVFKRELVRVGVVIPCQHQVIVTYDLHTCRFGELSVPDYLSTMGKVIELDGKLCYVHWLGSMWAVQVYNSVERSWTKQLSIAHSYFVRDIRGLTYMARYELGGDRKVGLFVWEAKLFWYNISKNKVMEVVCVPTTWLQQQQLLKTSDERKLTTTKSKHRSVCCTPTPWMRKLRR